MELDDPERLFDLSTVLDESSDVSKVGKIRKRIISVSKPILANSTIAIKTERYIRYEEVVPQDHSLSINLFKPCGTLEQQSGHSPCMPSLRLEMLDKEYDEPVRDRNKDWILDSQRPIFNEKGRDIVDPKFELRLGKYKKVEAVSKQFWAKEYQMMLRECLMHRQAVIISDTNCIVEIFGVGFSGRMYSEGSAAPKLLVVEVYSIWNSQKYTLVLTVMEMRLLLVENPDLLKPGKKPELLRFVVGALYFEYTVTIPAKHSSAQQQTQQQTGEEEQASIVTESSTGDVSKKNSAHQSKPSAHLSHLPVASAPAVRPQPHPHTTKKDRQDFKLHLQKELLNHTHALRDAELEQIVPVNTHHDPAVHVGLHSDLTVPHMQVHFHDDRPVHSPHPHTASHQPSPARGSHSASRGPSPVPGPSTLSANQVLDQEVIALQNPGTDITAASISQHDSGSVEENSCALETGTAHPAVLDSATVSHPPKEKPTENSEAVAEPETVEVAVGDKEIVQMVVHLDLPIMPKGYPKTVEEMIRVPPVPPENSSDPQPIVTQQLHIGYYKRENGPQLRKRQASARRLAEEREEQRLRAIWLATPKHRRNLKGIRLVRRCNYMVVLSCYFDPLRPNTIIVLGTVAGEATCMTMYLGLGRIKELLQVDTSCLSWSSDEMSRHVTAALQYAGIVKTDSSDGYAINVHRSTGLETALRKEHTVGGFLQRIRARQRQLHSAQFLPTDPLKTHYTPILDDVEALGPVDVFALDSSVAVPTTRPGTADSALTQKSVAVLSDTPALGIGESKTVIAEGTVVGSTTPPRTKPAVRNSRRAPGWTSLGVRDSTRAVGVALGSPLRPIREIGKHRRLSSRAVRIGHVYGTYSLYANTDKMPKYRSEIPVWPVRDHSSQQLAIEEDDATLEPESDDEDFLKADGDSEDSDSEDENNSSNQKKKRKKKRNGKESEPEEINEADEKNDAYATYAEGLVLELHLYLPYPSEFQSLPIPSGTFRMDFTVSELDPIFPIPDEKERIVRCLRAVYCRFFDTATAEEVAQAESDWDWFARTLLKRSRWAVRGGVSSRFATAVWELQQSRLGIDLLQEMFDSAERLQYVQSLLYTNAAAPVATVPGESDGSSMRYTTGSVRLSDSSPLQSEPAAEPSLVQPAVPPYATLTWPCTVWSKCMKIRCATAERGESVRLQVSAYQRGESLGIVCFDHERAEVYFAQHYDSALQLSQVQGFRFISSTERSLQLFLFLTASLTYTETDCQDGVRRGKVTFGAVDEEEAVLDAGDVVEDDYATATALLLNSAASKAQSRMKRK